MQTSTPVYKGCTKQSNHMHLTHTPTYKNIPTKVYKTPHTTIHIPLKSMRYVAPLPTSLQLSDLGTPRGSSIHTAGAYSTGSAEGVGHSFHLLG